LIGEPLKDRLRYLDRRELLSILLVGAMVVAGVAFWYVRSLPRPVSVELTGEQKSSGSGDVQASPSPSSAPIVVHVAGWVHRPGVYQFQQGDRVIDAVRRAGGTRRGADLKSLNLAALLVDAQQILVLRRGQSSTPQGTQTAGETLVNVNTATIDQLESLPGIGPTLAQRIIDHREEHGPFRSVDELLDVSGIGDQTLAELRPKVTV
jgi:competence protein ComEA